MILFVVDSVIAFSMVLYGFLLVPVPVLSFPVLLTYMLLFFAFVLTFVLGAIVDSFFITLSSFVISFDLVLSCVTFSVALATLNPMSKITNNDKIIIILLF